ncbi:MAG: efflux RND transporter permease subunit [Pirellulaceae bacterium]
MSTNIAQKFAESTALLFSDLRRIVLLVLLTIGTGIAAICSLPCMEDPPLSQRAISVVTLFPGADAEQVESQVTEVIEEQLLDVPELKRLRSQSRPGASWISFEVNDSIADPESVWTRVREKVDKSIPYLPAGVAKPKIEGTTVAAYSWLGALVWTKEGAVDWELLRHQAQELETRLSGIPGTKSIDLFAEPEIEIQVSVDPAKTAALGSSVAELAQRLRGTDAHTGAGAIRGKEHDLFVRPESRFDEVDDIANAPVFVAAGSILRLKDVATIRRQMRNPASSLALVDGKPAVVIGARLDPDVSIRHWMPHVQEVCSTFDSHTPAGIELESLLIQDDYVSARLGDLLWNLVMGLFVVSLVTLLMMGWRSALIVSISLPLSSLMVLSGMHFLNIPIHQISITGLIIALGLLIDNAIIAVDETSASLKVEKTMHLAIVSTVGRLVAPMAGSTLTTALAFTPLAMMVGPSGEFLSSLGITLILAVGSSLLLSLTLLPMLVGRFGHVSAAPTTNKSWWRDCLHSGLQTPRLQQAYRTVLHRLLKKPLVGVAYGMAVPTIGLLLFPLIPEQFFPPSDRNQFRIDLELGASSSIDSTVEATRKVDRLLKQHQQIVRVHWTVGSSAPSYYYNQIPLRNNTPSFAQAIIQVDGTTVDLDWIRRLQFELQREMAEASVTVMPFMQGPPVGAPVEVRIYGQDLNQLHAYGEELRHRLAAIDGVINTRADLGEARATVDLHVNRLRARAAGLDEQSIANQIFANLEGLNGGSLAEQQDETPIRVQIAEEYRNDTNQLDALSIAVRGPNYAAKQSTSLGALAKTRLLPQACCITHMNGERLVEVQAYLDPFVLPSTVVRKLSANLANRPLKLDNSYRLEFGGESAEREIAVQALFKTVPFVGIFMVVTLVLALRSFRQTFLIALVGLLAVGAATGSLWLFGFPFGLTAIVGTLGLVGIAINDSIVVVSILSETARQGRADDQTTVDSMVGAARHVITTSLTTMFGFMPLVLGGGLFWPPLAIVISAGVLGATSIALTLVPCAFKLLTQAAPELAFSMREQLESNAQQTAQSEPPRELTPALEQSVPLFPALDLPTNSEWGAIVPDPK